jgi:DNA repair protein RadC
MKTKYSTVPLYSLKLIREKNIKYPIVKATDALSAATCLRYYLKDKDCEHLVCLMLDGQNNLVGLHNVAIGGISGLHSSPRDMMKAAIVGRAHAIIMGHNHPSGDPNPSPEDITFTKTTVEAGKILGIPVVDHIIVSSGINERHFSFYENNLI